MQELNAFGEEVSQDFSDKEKVRKRRNLAEANLSDDVLFGLLM